MRYREVTSPVVGTQGAEAQESPSSLLPVAVLLLLFLRVFASSRLRVQNIGGTHLPDEPKKPETGPKWTISYHS